MVNAEFGLAVLFSYRQAFQFAPRHVQIDQESFDGVTYGHVVPVSLGFVSMGRHVLDTVFVVVVYFTVRAISLDE